MLNWHLADPMKCESRVFVFIFSPPKAGLFRESHHYSQAMRLVSQKFADNDVDHSISLYLVWGIRERDMSSCHFSDYECLGKQVFDDSFNPSTMAAQQSFVVISMQQPLSEVTFSRLCLVSLTPLYLSLPVRVCLLFCSSLFPPPLFPPSHRSSFGDPVRLTRLGVLSLSPSLTPSPHTVFIFLSIISLFSRLSLSLSPLLFRRLPPSNHTS